MDAFDLGRAAALSRYGVKLAGTRQKEASPLFALPALAAAGTYTALRKFRPSANPALAALQNKARNSTFQVATAPDTGRGIRSLLFGAKDVSPRRSGNPGTLVLNHSPSQMASSAASINTGQLPEALDDKWIFHQLMTQGTGGGGGLPGSVPNTHRLDRALREVGGDPSKLTRLMGDQGYVIKPRTGSMSKADTLLSHTTDPRDPRLRQALQNPENFILQEKLPISNEFRVHTLNNEPLTASHRQIPHKGLRSVWDKYMGGGGGAFVPVVGDNRRKLMDFARESTKHLGVTPEGNNILGDAEHLHHALDIAQLPDGSFKLIESNPVPGTFMNPLVNRRVQQAATGRVPRDVAALAALGVGGLGTAATALATKKQRGTEDDSDPAVS